VSKPIPEADIRTATEVLHLQLAGTTKSYDQMPATNLRQLRRVAIAVLQAVAPEPPPPPVTLRDRVAARLAYASRITAPLYRAAWRALPAPGGAL
jgi:hypothetical protein